MDSGVTKPEFRESLIGGSKNGLPVFSSLRFSSIQYENDVGNRQPLVLRQWSTMDPPRPKTNNKSPSDLCIGAKVNSMKDAQLPEIITAEYCAEKVLTCALESEVNGSITTQDLLRALERQSRLLFETENVKEQLQTDPFENLGHPDFRSKVDRLGKILKVTESHRISTLSGYTKINATVEIPMLASMANAGGQKKMMNTGQELMQLVFQYEREAEQKKNAETRINPGEDPPTVWYSIDISFGKVAPKERVLCVQVWSDGNRPKGHHLKPHDLESDADDGNEDGWEDVDDEEDEDGDGRQESKRQRREPKEDEEGKASMNTDCMDVADDDGVERSDRFVADMDPDVLHQFLECLDLNNMDEATAFFLLMTFPFYEHEWDLVGFVLSSVFGPSEEEGDEDD